MKYDLGDITAVVLAGGPEVAFDAKRPAQKKALMRFRGKPSIDYVLDTLRKVPPVRRIAIAGMSADELTHVEGARTCDFLPLSGRSMVDHAFGALNHFAADAAVCFITADAPLITPVSMIAFLNLVGDTPSAYSRNIFVPVVPARCFTGAYREVTKSAFQFRGGAVRHGNLAVVDTRLGADVDLKKRLDRLYQHRKSAVKSLSSLSLAAGTAIVMSRLLPRALHLQTLARLVSGSLGTGVHPIVVPHPELAVDADEPEDCRFIERVLESLLREGVAPER